MKKEVFTSKILEISILFCNFAANLENNVMKTMKNAMIC